jgi:hypothetical protein
MQGILGKRGAKCDTGFQFRDDVIPNLRKRKLKEGRPEKE